MPVSYLSTDEADILKHALTALSDATGARTTVLGKEALKGNWNLDAVIRISFRTGPQEFFVEIKGEMRQIMLNGILSQFSEGKEKWLLVSRYIPAPLKTKLRTHGINYLEITGNCYINSGPLYLYINDLPVKQARETIEGKLWKATGLKLLFLLLQDPTLIGATYRHLAQLAGIGLGSVSLLLEELRKQQYLKVGPFGTEVFEHRDRLIGRWTELYPLILRPKLVVGQFRFADNQHPVYWKMLPNEGVYWSADQAGEIYARQLIPQTYTVYTNRKPNELIKRWKLIPDSTGNLIILEKFWEDWPGSRSLPAVVPPLLAYADLLDSTDSRTWESAQIIKNNYLNGYPV